MKKTFSILAASLILTGCAGMFGGGDLTSCGPNGAINNKGEGVPCVSTRTAYQLSNTNNQFSGNYRISGANGTGGGGQVGGMMNDAPVGSIAVSMPQAVQQPMPIMEPAKVMRVWVNNWTDSAGDLHYPSYVFTEITPRRWAVGANANKGAQAKILTPYRIEGEANTQATLVSAGPSSSSSPIGPQQAAAASAMGIAPQQSIQGR